MLRKGLSHHVENVQPTFLCFREGIAQDLERDPLGLDIHLDRRDPLAGTGDFEVHVTQMVFHPQDIGQHRYPITLCDQAHRHACTGRLQRNARIHQG